MQGDRLGIAVQIDLPGERKRGDLQQAPTRSGLVDRPMSIGSTRTSTEMDTKQHLQQSKTTVTQPTQQDLG
eukprot:2239874-Rhodomonas_salina.1